LHVELRAFLHRKRKVLSRQDLVQCGETDLEERIVEMPPEWGGIIPAEVFIEEGRRLVDEAVKHGMSLRLLGGVAIRIHCSEFLEFARKLVRLGPGQQEYTDLDYMSYSKFRSMMKSFFQEMGYGKRPATLSSAATQRQIYFHPKGWFYVDVFFDHLRAANHPLDFRGRLDLDTPTVTPTDLLLEKVQIVLPGEKDVKDVILLLRSHEVSEQEERNRINAKFIATKLCADWGFWYTVTTNLSGLKQYVADAETLDEGDRQDVTKKIEALLDTIEEEPKSAGWKMRSVIGPKKKWYNPVETSETVGEFGIWKLRERK